LTCEQTSDLKRLREQAHVKKLAPKKLPASNPEKKPFNPEILERTGIAIPLLRQLEGVVAKRFEIIIDLNLDYPGARRHHRKASR